MLEAHAHFSSAGAKAAAQMPGAQIQHIPCATTTLSDAEIGGAVTGQRVDS
jgi:hypothetical protein